MEIMFICEHLMNSKVIENVSGNEFIELDYKFDCVCFFSENFENLFLN